MTFEEHTCNMALLGLAFASAAIIWYTNKLTKKENKFRIYPFMFFFGGTWGTGMVLAAIWGIPYILDFILETFTLAAFAAILEWNITPQQTIKNKAENHVELYMRPPVCK